MNVPNDLQDVNLHGDPSFDERFPPDKYPALHHTPEEMKTLKARERRRKKQLRLVRFVAKISRDFMREYRDDDK